MGKISPSLANSGDRLWHSIYVSWSFRGILSPCLLLLNAHTRTMWHQFGEYNCQATHLKTVVFAL